MVAAEVRLELGLLAEPLGLLEEAEGPLEEVGLLDEPDGAEGVIVLESGAAPLASPLMPAWTCQPGLVLVENSCIELGLIIIV